MLGDLYIKNNDYTPLFLKTRQRLRQSQNFEGCMFPISNFFLGKLVGIK